MKRYRIPIIAASTLAAAAMVLSGCSASGSNSSGSKTVSFWVRDSESSFANKLVTQFNKTHEDEHVKLTIVPSADFVQKFGTAAAGGDAPDVAAMDLVYAPYFASVGALTDISGKVKTLPWRNEMSPGHTSQGKYKGKTYALPFTGDVSVMYYNKDLFTKAGLDPNTPPTTMAEVQADSEKIAALGNGTYGFAFSGACGGCNIFSMGPYVWAQGGNVISADGKKAEFDSPAVASTLNMYRNLWRKGAMPQLVKTDGGSNAGDAFAQGKVGIFNYGDFYLSTLEDPSSGAKFNWGLALIPGEQKGQTASFAGGDDIAIPSGSKNPEGAWEFLKWVTGSQGQTVLADNGIMPIRLDLLDKIYTSKDPRNAVFAKALSQGKVPYSTVENELINDSNGVWSTLIQDAVFGSGSVSAAQAKAQKAAQAILDKNNN